MNQVQPNDEITGTHEPSTAPRGDGPEDRQSFTDPAATIEHAGRFQVRQEIARGGMGVVYLAYDADLGREVAIKTVRVANGEAIRRFLDEAKISGQLQHPGVPPVYETGLLPDGRPFLAMKLIKGRSLADLLAERVDSSADSARFLGNLEQVCQAVAYAHAHKVIHRDLKPSNVMVGPFGEVQVMDWGLAKVLTADGNPPDLPTEVEAKPTTEIVPFRTAESETLTGSMLGTPAFMSPEQAAGEGDKVDCRADVFAIGATLCAILTGKPPYVGKDANAVRLMAIRGFLDAAYERLAACRAEPELVALCKRCLSADREGRPKDAGEVAASLATVRMMSEDRARQAELGRAKADFQAALETKRRRSMLLYGGSVLASLLVGGMVAGIQWYRAKSALSRATVEHQKTNDAMAEMKAQQRHTLTALSLMTDDLLDTMFANHRDPDESQKEFLKNALTLLQRAELSHEDTPAERNREAGIFCSIGRVYRALGDLESSVAAYTSARDLRLRAVREQPANNEFRDLLAYTHCKLGEALDDMGRPKEATAEYAKARDLRLKIVAALPNEVPYKEYLAWTRLCLAGVLDRSGNRNDAEIEYESARDLYKQLTGIAPTNEGYFSMLAECRLDLGDHYRSAGRDKESAAEFAAARDVLARLVSGNPDAPGYQNQLAESLARLASVANDDHAHREAKRLLEEAVPHLQTALRAKPKSREYRETFRDNRWMMANVLLALGEHRAVPRCVGEMISFSSDLARDNYEAAAFLARCAAQQAKSDSPADREQRNLPKKYASESVSYLRNAIKARYKVTARLRTDPYLDPLRGLPEFQHLVLDRESEAGPREVGPVPRLVR